MKKRLLLEEEGFTLTEVLVTMMVMITVLFALYSIFDMSLRIFSFGNNKTEAVENARLGLEKTEREVRAAYPYDKGNITMPDLHLFDSGTWMATQIKFGNDLDGNRKVECPNLGACEVISYQIYDTGSGEYALGRSNSSDGTLQPVVEHVDYDDKGTPDDLSDDDTGLNFRYFKNDGTTEVLPGGDETQVAIVRMELRIRVKNGVQDGTQTLKTEVTLKNRGG